VRPLRPAGPPQAQQKHATDAALAENENIRSSLTLELEAKDVQIQELTDTNELLQAEYNALTAVIICRNMT
jgi:hypothetical protein